MKVSVLMTVKILNEQMYEWFIQSLNSILKQNYEVEYEVIIIDDASPYSVTIPHEFYDVGKWLLQRLNTSYGIANAKNVGLNFCSGDLIIIQDGDDIAEPDLIKKQVEFMESHPDASACGVQSRAFHFETGEEMDLGGGFPTKHIGFIDLAMALNLGKQNIFWWLNQPGVCFRKDDVMRIGGYREGKCHGYDVPGMEDMVMWLRMVSAGLKIYNMPDILMNYRWKPSERTAENDIYQKALQHEHEKFMRGEME